MHYLASVSKVTESRAFLVKPLIGTSFDVFIDSSGLHSSAPKSTGFVEAFWSDGSVPDTHCDAPHSSVTSFHFKAETAPHTAAILWLVSLTHNDVVTVLFLLLALAFAPQPPRCKPQLAPLETGTSSGASDTAFWRKDEAGDWRGTGWLGWTWEGDALKPVTMIVRDRPKDLPGLSDDDVYVQSIPNVTFAVRCVSGLRAGKIQSAGVVNHNLQYSGPLDVSLGKLRYQVRVEAKDPAAADAKVILAHAGRTQVLYSADGFADEPHFEVIWAGDLDRDGKLDLVVNLYRKYSWHPYRLLLSTRAAGSEIVGEAAIFETGN